MEPDVNIFNRIKTCLGLIGSYGLVLKPVYVHEQSVALTDAHLRT